MFATLAVRWLAQRRPGAGEGDPPAWAAPAAGLASGALTTSTTTAGPPVVLYVLARGAPPVQTRDTLTATFIGFTLIGAVALLFSGRDWVPHAGALAALCPPRCSATSPVGRCSHASPGTTTSRCSPAC